MATDVAEQAGRAGPPAAGHGTAPAVATELAVTGTTCGTCAARIQRRLDLLPGVEASVNYASGRARVTHSPELDPAELVAAVTALGFGATPAAPLVPPGTGVGTGAGPHPGGDVPTPRTVTEGGSRHTAGERPAGPADDGPDPELAELRHRALVCLALTLPVIAVAMNPDWQFRYWQWFSLVLTAPVVVWGGWRFHRAAARHLRHLSGDDGHAGLGRHPRRVRLVAVDALRRRRGPRRHAPRPLPRPHTRPVRRLPHGLPRDGGRDHHRRPAGTLARTSRPAPRAGRVGGPDGPPAAEAGVVAGGRELPVAVDRVQPGDHVAVAAGEPFPLDGRVVEGRSSVDAGAMTGESTPVDVEPGGEVLAGTRNETARAAPWRRRAASGVARSSPASAPSRRASSTPSPARSPPRPARRRRRPSRAPTSPTSRPWTGSASPAPSTGRACWPAADLGVAMGTGAAMAIEAGDVTLVRDELRAVPDALRLARRPLGTIRGNLFWAFAYNVAALPLAVVGLLNPMIAGVTMALSSVFVVGNSLRLRRFRP